MLFGLFWLLLQYLVDLGHFVIIWHFVPLWVIFISDLLHHLGYFVIFGLSWGNSLCLCYMICRKAAHTTSFYDLVKVITSLTAEIHYKTISDITEKN